MRPRSACFSGGSSDFYLASTPDLSHGRHSESALDDSIFSPRSSGIHDIIMFEPNLRASSQYQCVRPSLHCVAFEFVISETIRCKRVY